jgi:hypothetical protein
MKTIPLMCHAAYENRENLSSKATQNPNSSRQYLWWPKEHYDFDCEKDMKKVFTHPDSLFVVKLNV